MRGARLEDCRDVDIGYQSKLSHRARSERGDEWKPTLNAKSSLLRYVASMPAPTNERQALEREELPDHVANYQRLDHLVSRTSSHSLSTSRSCQDHLVLAVGAEIDQWSQQVGRPLRIPRVAFPWPSASVWQALAGAPAEAPELVWDDDGTASNA